jgi:type IV pilus assembly protein PilF
MNKMQSMMYTKIKRLTILLLCVTLLTACATSGNSTRSVAEEKKKKLAGINIELGMGYLEEKDIQRAKQKLLEAMDADPSLPEVQYSMAYFYEATGDLQQANIYYLKAIALAPNRGDTQNNYGTYLCRAGEYRKSVEHFKMALQDPSYLDTAGAYENAGLCAMKIPDPNHALMYFNHAILQDANHPVSLINAAELEYNRGNYRAARQRLKEYLEIAPVTRQADRLNARLQHQPVV